MTAPENSTPAARSGVEPQPGPFIAHGASRDPEITSPADQEFAAMALLILFVGLILVALLLLRLIPFGEMFR